jgi:hypothetical protein
MSTPDSSDFLAQLREIPDPVSGAPAAKARPPLAPLAPDRGLTRRRRWLALVVALAWLGLNLAVFGVRGDLLTLPSLYVDAQIVLPFSLAIGSLAVALAPGRLGLGLGLGMVMVTAVLGPASFCLIGPGAPPPSEPAQGASSLLAAFVCLDITVAFAAVPLLLAGLVLRAAFPVGAGWRGASVGAAVGLLAGATINLHCANVARFHMLVGHGIPVIAATLIGAFVVARWTRA